MSMMMMKMINKSARGGYGDGNVSEAGALVALGLLASPFVLIGALAAAFTAYDHFNPSVSLTETFAGQEANSRVYLNSQEVRTDFVRGKTGTRDTRGDRGIVDVTKVTSLVADFSKNTICESQYNILSGTYKYSQYGHTKGQAFVKHGHDQEELGCSSIDIAQSHLSPEILHMRAALATATKAPTPK